MPCRGIIGQHLGNRKPLKGHDMIRCGCEDARGGETLGKWQRIESGRRLDPTRWPKAFIPQRNDGDFSGIWPGDGGMGNTNPR